MLSLSLDEKDVCLDTGGLTSGLQKGLVMSDGMRPLCEEGMGFGVPVVVNRSGTYLSFTADTEISRQDGMKCYRKTFYLDALQRVKTSGKEVESPAGYRWIEACGSVYKRLALLQRLLPVVVKIREKAGLHYFFKKTDPSGVVTVEYKIDVDKVYIQTDCDLQENGSEPGKLYFLNEQGARIFNRYGDTTGRSLSKSSIGGWVRTRADKAWMTSHDGKIGFAVYKKPGCVLYRGWELASDVLSWSGFIYDTSESGGGSFSYPVDIIEKT